MQEVELVVGVVGSVEFVQIYILSLFGTLSSFGVGAGDWISRLLMDKSNLTLSFSLRHRLNLVSN